MTGKEIAENLRNSKEKWGEGYLLRSDADGIPHYCVVGLKLHEAGIPDDFLNLKAEVQPFRKYHRALASRITLLFELNDACEDKEELMNVLDDDNHRDIDYPIEALVEFIKGTLLAKEF